MQNETSLKEYGTVHNAIITLGDTDDSGKGRHFKSRFIQPGVAGYPGQFGNVLITKESLDKFIDTMVGVPVIINHKDLNNDNVDDERVGVVNSVWHDEKDGWYWCDGIIWDETAQNLITDNNWSVSCSYDVKTADDKGGSENNIKYDMEFLDGVFTHLALVNNPRYERANIVFNSKTEILNSFPDHAGRKGQVGGSLPRGANANLSDDIDQVIAGTFPKMEMLNFGTPPDVLQDLGVPNKPMYMAQHKYLMSTERKEIDGEVHHIADETMKDLPNLLGDPLLVMTSRKNRNRYVVAINAKDKNDKYIFAIIDYDWQGKRNNIIPSVYGKDEYLEYIKNAYLNNEIVYQNKNLKISGSRVQFPRCNQKVSNSIINDINNYFNPNVKEHEDMSIQNWNEQDHPRDELGQFTEKGGGSAKEKEITRDYHLMRSNDYVKATERDNKKEILFTNDDETWLLTEVQDKGWELVKAGKVVKTFDDKYEADEAWEQGYFADVDSMDKKYDKQGYLINNNNPNVKEHEEMNVENDKWITVHPNGEDSKGRHLLLKDDETPKEAIDRTYKGNVKSDSKDEKNEPETVKDKIKKFGDKIPKNYKRNKQTELLWLYKNSYITRSEWEEERNNINNNKETDMALLDELKKLINKVENTKGEKDMEIDNEKVDKRDIIRQIMAIAGKEEASEDVRTIAKLAEKLAYDKSEAGTANNEVSDTKKVKKDDEENPKNSKEVKNEDEKDEKKVKEIKEGVKEDVENKCKNSVDNSKPDYFGRLNEIYNAATSNIEQKTEYVSRADREKAAEDYFKG